MRVWDASTGDAVLVLRGHTGPVAEVPFSPDGSMLASMAADGTARVWALALDDLVAMARRNVTRTLTAEECDQYLHVTPCPRLSQGD